MLPALSGITTTGTSMPLERSLNSSSAPQSVPNFATRSPRRRRCRTFDWKTCITSVPKPMRRKTRNRSIPLITFRLTARDLARFGLLMLRNGSWNGTQLIPAGWIEESTHAYTTDTRPLASDGAGYGYLWWVNGFGLPEKSFSGRGALAKYLVAFPERGLVVVYLNHVEFPDSGAAMSDRDIARLPTISTSQMGHLLELLLRAQQPNGQSTSN
jgi:hypothetical protein